MEGTITYRLDRAIQEYYDEHGTIPQVIVCSMPGLSDLTYEEGKINGLTEDERYLYELQEYKHILVATTQKRDYPEFALI